MFTCHVVIKDTAEKWLNQLKVNLELNPDSDFENDSLKVSDYALTLDTKV